MPTLHPRYSSTEFSQRGTAIYESKVRSLLTAQDMGKFVAIDIETETWELDVDDYTATERLLQRMPDAQIWLVSVGSRATYRIGGARRSLGEMPQ